MARMIIRKIINRIVGRCGVNTLEKYAKIQRRMYQTPKDRR
jgi:hypothetical protein